MSLMQQPTVIEQVAGSRATETALTIVTALSGGPLAALLPVLAGSLASERQKLRVESALTAIDTILKRHEKSIRNLTDEQYKLINETVLTLLHTTDTGKIEYLKRAVQNTLIISDIKPQESVALSRIIRDMSGDEAKFLFRSSEYERIHVTFSDLENNIPSVLLVAPGSFENLVVTGLISLGLLESGEASWGDLGRLRFSPIVPKLRELLAESF